MKKQIISLCVLSALLFAACEDYNEQFDGYGDIDVYGDVQNVEYTLSDGDYGTIAGYSENRQIALTAGLDTVSFPDSTYTDSTLYNELISVKANKYFTEDIKAGTYLPAFVKNYKPWFTLDNGSTISITYNQQIEAPEQIGKIAAAAKYTLSAEDYASAWDGGEGYEFYTPAHAPASYLPAVLKKAISEPVSGDYAIVTYSYSNNEPSTGGAGGGGEQEEFNQIGDLTAAAVAGAAKIKGTVIATYSRGMLVSDGTGSILAYLGSIPAYSLGDEITVEGNTSLYNGLLQFTADATYTKISTGNAISTPAPVTINLAGLKDYTTAPSVKYVTYTGILSINGSYCNITFEEDETIQGSISYPFGSIINSDLDGETVQVTGYLIGTSGSSTKYINTMATSVVMEGAAAPTSIGEVLLSEAGNYSVCGMVSATYARGFLLTDGTGSILVYTNAPTEYVEGDIVKVSGTTSEYAGLKQYSSAAVCEKTGSSTLARPVLQTLTAGELDAYLTAPQVTYATYTGTLTISGTYYNVAIEGAATAIGSLSYPVDGTIDAALDGKQVTVTGYLIGVSSSKYVNTMVLSVVEATADEVKAQRAPRRAAAKVATETTYAVYQFDGTSWSEATETAILQKTDYTAMGQSYANLSKSKDVAYYLPLYLAKNYPYAAADDEITLVYFYYSSSVTNTVAAVYKFDGTTWVNHNNIEQGVAIFSKVDGAWNYENRAAYLDESFLGDQGDFTIVNVELSTLTYVWAPNSTYGMKASGYYSGSHEVESWVVSPAVTLDRDSVKLTFEHALNYLSGNNRADYVQVLITTDDYNGTDDPATVQWTELTVPQWPDGSSWTFVTSYTTDEAGNILDTIDLTPYNGSTIHIAFRYVGTATCCVTWEVKNLLLQ